MHVPELEAVLASRVEELLTALHTHSPLRAAALMVLLDDVTPNENRILSEVDLPVSAGATNRYVLDRAAERMGVGRIDREKRDEVFRPLRNLGLVDVARVTTRKELLANPNAPRVVVGTWSSKAGTSSYTVTDEARALLKDTPAAEWSQALASFCAGSEERKERVKQREAATSINGPQSSSPHSALIRVCVNAILSAPRFAGYELAYVDDGDGDRITEQEKKRLQALGLSLGIDDFFPDALLVDPLAREIWIVEAVISDGEVDGVKLRGLRRWAEKQSYKLAGATTAYETYKRFAVRQTRHSNIPTGTSVWIAENGGQLMAVESLASS